MSGEKRGLVAGSARFALALGSHAYEWAVRRRNLSYDTGDKIVLRVDRPVISIGNITTGGTGKTPVCIWLAEQFVSMGLKPAVVSRGYGADKGLPNDEMFLLSHRVPLAICVANPYRTAAAQFAIEEYGADVILMDDGFQHRALGRDLDIVLIDATRPFGFDHVLPRGLLREPLDGLRRADLFIVTRSNLVDANAHRQLAVRLAEYNPSASIVRSSHRQAGFSDPYGNVSDEPGQECRRVLLSAGIGNPSAFATSVQTLGYEVLGACWWPDHARYRLKDARYLQKQARDLAADAIFTTEKDMVKLGHIDVEWPIPIRALRVEIEFHDAGATEVMDRVRRVIEPFERSQDVQAVPTD